MNLDRKSWHVRLFFSSHGICDKFTGFDRNWYYDDFDRSWYYDDESTNLCHYVRVILLYAPLVFLAHLIFLAAALYVLILLPFQLFGTGYWYAIGIIAALAALAGIAVWFHRRWEFVWSKKHEEKTSQPTPEPEPVKVKRPGFFEVLWNYLIAVKQKICPTVNFYTQEEAK